MVTKHKITSFSIKEKYRMSHLIFANDHLISCFHANTKLYKNTVTILGKCHKMVRHSIEPLKCYGLL